MLKVFHLLLKQFHYSTCYLLNNISSQPLLTSFRVPLENKIFEKTSTFEISSQLVPTFSLDSV